MRHSMLQDDVKRSLSGPQVAACAVVYPGPEPAVPPGLAPGGIVFQLWVNGKIQDQASAPQEDPRVVAERHNAVLDSCQSGDVVSVHCFDGDTGQWKWTRQVCKP
jgi:hypothetical protein